MPRTKLQQRNELPIVPDYVRPDLVGVTWGLEDVAKTVKRDSKFVSKFVLRPNWRVLDHSAGGPVMFPGDKPQQLSNAPYRIQARPMAYWIEQHWNQIQGKGWPS